MSLSPDLLIRVTVEYFQALNDLLLIARRRAVTHVVQNLISHVVILVLCQLKQPVPEIRLVRLDSARAHLLSGLKSNLGVLVPGELNDYINVLSVSNLGHELVDVLLSSSLRLLLRVDL